MPPGEGYRSLPRGKLDLHLNILKSIKKKDSSDYFCTFVHEIIIK